MLGAAVMAGAALLSGCAHSVTGAAVAVVDESVFPLRAADTALVLLSPDQISAVVGGVLQVDADRHRPVPGGSAVAACSPLDAVGMAAFVGQDWSGFRVLLFTGGADQVVAEAVAVYPDAVAAAEAFGSGTRDVHTCDGQQALGAGGDAAWRFSVSDRGPDMVRWSKEQLAVPLTWVCHGEARLRNNAVLQAMACQGDDGGAQLVTRLADRMSASVWELSTR